MNLPLNPKESFIKRNPHLYGGANVSPSIGQMPEPPKKRIRQSSKPLMNKLEAEALARLKSISLFPELWRAQAMRFRLGNGIWYKPDFAHIANQICVEVKGPHAFRGGMENLKVAAGLYPEMEWRLMWKQDGQWLEQRILP